MGLGEQWLGKRLGEEDLVRLEQLRGTLGIHPGGEGGEFETIVLDGPLFKRHLEIEFEKRMESEERGELVITRIVLVNKAEEESPTAHGAPEKPRA
jgi:diphthine-ammonia ligase